MAKHTPSPWTACIEGENQQFGESHEIQAGKHWACVASVPFSSCGTTAGEPGETKITRAQAKANARLIAAAPELLAAARAALEWIEAYEMSGPARRMLQEAIAKAEQA